MADDIADSIPGLNTQDFNQSAAQVRAATNSQKQAERAARVQAHAVPATAKVLAEQAAMTDSADLLLSGSDPSATVPYGLYKQVLSDPSGAVQNVHGIPVVNDNGDLGSQIAESESNREEGRQALREEITAADRWNAALRENTITAGVLRGLMKPAFAADPNFNYVDQLSKVETADITEDQAEWLRDSKSQDDLNWRINRIQQENRDAETLMSGGKYSAFMWSLAGGLVDPAGWALGGGMGKAAQLSGVAARAAEAGIAARAGLNVFEGAAGNVLGEAALQAAGENVTPGDYGRAAGIGMVFGAASLPLEFARSVRATGMRMQEEATARELAIYKKAEQEAGPNATPEDIKTRVNEIHAQNIQDQYRWLLADPNEGDVVTWGRAEQGGTTAQPGPVEGAPESAATAVEQATQQAAPLDDISAPLQSSVSSDVNRPFIDGLYRFAKQWRENNDVDAPKTILQKIGAESTSLTMLSSKNPLMNYIGAVIGEMSGGGAERRRTASMLKTMLYRQYFAPAEQEFQALYRNWSGRRGGVAGALDDTFSGNDWARFNETVEQVRENRRRTILAQEEKSPFKPLEREGINPEADPVIKRAADLLDEHYTLMAEHQRQVGTIGAGGLKGSSVGYTPRRFDPAKLMNLPQRYREAYIEALTEQLNFSEGFDVDFSRKLATRILERGNHRAKGSFDAPASVYSKEGGDVVEEALSEMDLTPEQRAQAERRFARGGARYTKQRLDLDVNKRYPIGNGESIALFDLLDHDQMSLLRSYSNRASGEVALAKFGIPGMPGVRLVRQALESDQGEFGGTTIHELRAFDQLMSQMFGVPVASWQNQAIDNVVGLTSLARLGFMGLPQLAEYTNGIVSLGIGRTMTAIPEFGKMYKELADLGKGKEVNNAFLSSWEKSIGGAGFEEFHMNGVAHASQQPEMYGAEKLGTVSRLIRSGQNLQAKLSFNKAITGVQTRWATTQIMRKVGDLARTGEADVALRDMGISSDVIRRVMQYEPFEYRNGKAVSFNAQKVLDNQALADLLNGVQRGAAQIVQRQFPGETGQYVGKSWLRMLTQFRQYGLIAVEKQWGRNVRNYGYARALGYLMGSMSIAAPLYLMRTYVQAAGLSGDDRKKFLDRATTPSAIAQATLNYASSSGLLGDVLDIGSALTGRQVIGGRTGTSPGGIVESVVPGVGFASDVAQAVGGVDPHKLLHVLPFSGLPYLQPVLNSVESGLDPAAKRIRADRAAAGREAGKQWYNQPVAE